MPPIRGSPADGSELQDMVSTADRDLFGPHAPLLNPADTSPDYHNNEDVFASKLGHASGWFIWVLTFSAGLSGLLFGYEYAQFPDSSCVIFEADGSCVLTALVLYHPLW